MYNVLYTNIFIHTYFYLFFLLFSPLCTGRRAGEPRLGVAGRDATVEFETMRHSSAAHQQMEKLFAPWQTGTGDGALKCPEDDPNRVRIITWSIGSNRPH